MGRPLKHPSVLPSQLHAEVLGHSPGRLPPSQASRSPEKKFYRSTPLRGLFVREKGGFDHDGRFADLNQNGRTVIGRFAQSLGGHATERFVEMAEYPNVDPRWRSGERIASAH